MRRNFDDFAHDGQLLAPQTISGDGDEHNGSGVDMKHCRTGVVVFNIGAVVAAATISVMIQKSEDDSTWEDAISAAKTFATADANSVVTQAVIDMERYWRIQYTVTNNKDALFGAVGVGWDAPYVPVP